jgi:hypothetical protein
MFVLMGAALAELLAKVAVNARLVAKSDDMTDRIDSFIVEIPMAVGLISTG